MGARPRAGARRRSSLGGAVEAAEAFLGRRVEPARSRSSLPGRLERAATDEIWDGAHNPDGRRLAARAAARRRLLVCVSILARQGRRRRCSRALAARGDTLVATRPANPARCPRRSSRRSAEPHFAARRGGRRPARHSRARARRGRRAPSSSPARSICSRISRVERKPYDDASSASGSASSRSRRRRRSRSSGSRSLSATRRQAAPITANLRRDRSRRRPLRRHHDFFDSGRGSSPQPRRSSSSVVFWLAVALLGVQGRAAPDRATVARGDGDDARARPAVHRRRSSTCSSARPSTSRTCASASSRSRRWRSGLGGRDLTARSAAPRVEAASSSARSARPGCGRRARRASAARAALAGLPVLRDADRRRRPSSCADRCSSAHAAELLRRLPATRPRPTSRLRRRWRSSAHSSSIKPDAVERGAGRRDPRAASSAAASTVRGARAAVASTASSAARALRRAQREAVLRRARRVHHLGADAGARARGGGRDRDVRDDDGRDESGRRRRPARSAATSRSSMPDNLVHGSDSPRVGRARDRALVPHDCLTRDASGTARVWTKSNAEYTDAHARERVGGGGDRTGACAASRSPSSACSATSPGKDVVELGCGTAYFSAWLARRGARPVGVDITPAQLETARRMQARDGIEFPLVEANAEERAAAGRVVRPRVLRVRRVDLVRPVQWIPEAARLLRPGGELVFLRNSTLVVLCSPDDRTAGERPLLRAAARAAPDGVGRGRGVEFQLAARRVDPLLRENGFEVEALTSSGAGGGGDARYYDFVAPSGRASGRRGDLEGAQAGERPAARRRSARVDSRPQRRAILEQLGIPFDVVAPRYERTTRRRPSVELVRGTRGQGALGRGGGDRPVLGVDTEVVARRRSCSASRRTRPRPRRCSRSSSGRTHEVVSGPLPDHAGLGVSQHDTTLVTFRRADAARPRRSYLARGEWEGRAGGYAIQGLRRGAGRADRGRLPERRRPARRAARPALAERFPGAYGFG